ncbi:MAG TPA: type II 3-dehydroquinate dehydratase [Frankiaceae bacterium]|nr:type II 3-dehydroquinate dehydratase [Frankiaceae bacterium]
MSTVGIGFTRSAPASAKAAVWVLSGVNLGRLGLREPDVYGNATYDDLENDVRALAADLGVTVDVRQTDDETEMIHWLHDAADAGVAVVLNPGAWSHYSYAVRDACAALAGPLIEVHLSQTAKREEFRHTSVISAVADGTITGLGFESYRLGLRAAARLLADTSRAPSP